MRECEVDGVSIAYEVTGEGEPVVLVCGCGQPAIAWQLEQVPALTAAGYQVVTFDNRGVAPSSSPPAPYSIDVECDLARAGHDLPPLFFATETLRYLPNHELQDDTVVDMWLALIGDQEPWPNPGRLGQYEACLAWSNDLERTRAWPAISVPCLVLSFEHDVDSPPARAREAAAAIPGARFVEIPGASHLGVFTHGQAVAAALVDFFASL